MLCIDYFNTTLPTNFTKFPLFEVLNEVISKLDGVHPTLKGVLAGALFTTATLPLTNYRYCKSVQEEVSLSSPKLRKAYIPTVVRDMICANSRNAVTAALEKAYPGLTKTTTGRILAMFITVVAACIKSSPGNEWRGYTLQPADRKKPVGEIFQLIRYLRSTSIGAVVMGTSLGVSTVVGPPVQRALPLLKDKRVIAAAIAIGLAYQYETKKND